MPISSFIGKSKSFARALIAKSLHMIIIPVVKMYLTRTQLSMLLLLSFFPQNTSYPTKRQIQKNSPSEHTDSKLSKQISASVSSQLISWVSKPSYYSIANQDSQQTSASIKDRLHLNSHPRSSWGSKSSI